MGGKAQKLARQTERLRLESIHPDATLGSFYSGGGPGRKRRRVGSAQQQPV